MVPRYCDHTFFHIKHDIEYDDQNNEMPNTIHAVVTCIYCGQVRHLYADGRVLIIKEEGEVKKVYGNGNTSTTKTA